MKLIFSRIAVIQSTEIILIIELIIEITRPSAIPEIAAIIILSVRTEMNTFIAIRAAPSRSVPINVHKITGQSGVAKNEITIAYTIKMQQQIV